MCSNDVYAGEKGNLIHHVFFCLNHEKTGLNHLSFEVPDIDDVAMGRGAAAEIR
jgi:hypothetical protein